MPTKDEIKAKLCVELGSREYPLGELVDWAEQEHYREVLRHLRQIQLELYEEEHTWMEASAFGDVSSAIERTRRWSSYCALAKRYYQALVDAPARKPGLSSLLSNLKGGPKPH